MKEEGNFNELNIFSLKDLYEFFWHNRLPISLITVSVTLIFLLYSLSLPNMYTSQMLLKTSESIANKPQGTQAGLDDLVSFSSNFSQNQKGIKFVNAKLKSKDFLDHLISFPSIKEKLYASQSSDISSKTIIYNNALFDKESSSWNRYPDIYGNESPSATKIHTKYLSQTKFIYDQRTGFLKVSFTHVSPHFAKEFLDLALDEINNLQRNLDLELANQSLEYLKTELLSTDTIEVKEAITSLIESQFNKKMLAHAQKDYLVTAIDRPFLPERKSSPSRSTICFMGLIIGFLLSISFVLLRNSFFK